MAARRTTTRNRKTDPSAAAASASQQVALLTLLASFPFQKRGHLSQQFLWGLRVRAVVVALASIRLPRNRTNPLRFGKAFPKKKTDWRSLFLLHPPKDHRERLWEKLSRVSFQHYLVVDFQSRCYCFPRVIVWSSQFPLNAIPFFKPRIL